MKTKNVLIDDVLASPAEYETNFSKYSNRVMAALKLPSDAPVFDAIQKNNTARVWAERKENTIVMLVEVNLDEFKK